MLQTNIPFALVTVSIFPCVNTVAVSFAFMPFPDVTIIKESTPDTIAMLEASLPFAIVYFSIHPGVDTFSISFSHLEVSVVRVAVRVPFETLSIT